MQDLESTRHSQEPSSSMKKSTDVLIQKAAGVMLVIVILSSAILSWSGLVKLAEISGMTGWTAYMLPITIDGALLLGSLLQLHGAFGKRKSSFGNLLAFFGVSLSIGGNIYSSPVHGWNAGFHAIPPIMLFLSLYAFEQIIKHRITAEQSDLKKKARKALIPALKVASSDVAAPNIEELRSVISLMTDASKANKIRSMLSLYPEASNSALASALGAEMKTVGTTISRVRKGLLSDGAITTAPVSLESRPQAASAVLPA